MFLSSFAVAAAVHAGTPVAGEKFPDLKEYGLVGDLPDTTTAKVVIVDFWASWCAPCKASFPVFEELHRDLAGKGLVIVGVSVDENVRAYDTFLKRMKPGFAVVHDAGKRLVARVALPTMPTSFVLDAKGVVRFVHQGFHGEKSRREYLEQIQSLLSEQS